MSQTFDKKLNVRINHKYDTYENWKDSEVILGKGEIAVAEVSTDKTGLTPPAIGIKIGNGTKKFNELPWIQSTAGDVYAWAKEEAPEKLFKRNPQTNEYIYTDFIKEVEGLVRGTIDDSNTTYEFEYNPATDKYEITSIDITADGEVRQEWAEIDLSKKANKIIVEEGVDVVGNIVTLNAYGDIANSGEKLADYIKAKDVEETYETKAEVSKLAESVNTNLLSITEIQTETIPAIQTAITDNKTRIDGLFPTVNEEGTETDKGYIKTEIGTAIAGVIDNAPENLNTLREIAEFISGSTEGEGAASLVNRVTTNEQNIANLTDSVTGILNTIGTESDGLVADIIANTNAISTLEGKVGDENGGLVKDVADNASAISDIQGVIGEDGETKTGLRKDIADNTSAISTLSQTVSNGRVAWDEAVQDVLVGDETESDRKYTTKDDASKKVSLNAIPLNILENVEGFTLLFDCGNAFGFNV